MAGSPATAQKWNFIEVRARSLIFFDLEPGEELTFVNNLGHQGVAFSGNGHSVPYYVKSSEEFVTVLS